MSTKTSGKTPQVPSVPSSSPSAHFPLGPKRGAAQREAIAQLKQEIARIETAAAPEAPGTTAPGPVRFGIAAIDRHLPGGGLATGAVHEIIAGDDGMAATGFALVLAARLAAVSGRRGWLWCGQGLPLYGPGLAGFGCDPGGLVLLRGASDREVLWAMEEGLGSPALAAVFGEVAALTPQAGRRLALAARHNGVTAIVLRGRDAAAELSVAATRWRVAGLPLAAAEGMSHSTGATGYAWRLDFLRGGGAMPRSWPVLWQPVPRPVPPTDHQTGTPWPEDHDWQTDITTPRRGAVPGTLSLAAPLPGGAGLEDAPAAAATAGASG